MLWILTIAAAVAVVLLAIPLSMWATAGIRKNKRAFAIAAALFLAFGLYNPTQEKIVEGRADDEESHGQKSGDPP